MEVKDSNGNALNTGNSEIVIKTLIAKGTAKDIKKGTVVKNILVTDEDEMLMLHNFF